jgi:hypothetical protein
MSWAWCADEELIATLAIDVGGRERAAEHVAVLGVARHSLGSTAGR